MDRRILPLAFLLLLPPFTRAAGDAPLDRATLTGLKAVGIVIDMVDPEIEKLGVSRDRLLAQLKSSLEAEHIAVDTNAAEFLGLRLNAVRNGRGPYAVSVTVGLYQPVLLSRNHDMRTSTQTWEVESVLMADPKVLPTALSETAGDLVLRFTNAFHAVNPQ